MTGKVVRCDNCIHWNELSSSKEVHDDMKTRGQCRINPPRGSDTRGMGLWPSTREDEWCGKFDTDIDWGGMG